MRSARRDRLKRSVRHLDHLSCIWFQAHRMCSTFPTCHAGRGSVGLTWRAETLLRVSSWEAKVNQPCQEFPVHRQTTSPNGAEVVKVFFECTFWCGLEKPNEKPAAFWGTDFRGHAQQAGEADAEHQRRRSLLQALQGTGPRFSLPFGSQGSGFLGQGPKPLHCYCRGY